MALGGSTNAVLHLIAMGRAAKVPITIDDFEEVSEKVPFVADLKPSGRYVMEDLHRYDQFYFFDIQTLYDVLIYMRHSVGGTPAVLKYLLEKGVLNGDCLTVTGKTLAENLKDLPSLQNQQDIIYPIEKPIKNSGHIRILKGDLAPEGSVAKITGKEGLVFKGKAKV